MNAKSVPNGRVLQIRVSTPMKKEKKKPKDPAMFPIPLTKRTARPTTMASYETEKTHKRSPAGRSGIG